MGTEYRHNAHIGTLYRKVIVQAEDGSRGLLLGSQGVREYIHCTRPFKFFLRAFAEKNTHARIVGATRRYLTSDDELRKVCNTIRRTTGENGCIYLSISNGLVS